MRKSRRQKVVLCTCLSLVGCVTASPPVRVGLHTSWPKIPLLLEAIESISIEEPNAFFPLLNALVNSDTLPTLGKLSSEAIHQASLQTATELGYLQDPGAYASAELQISLHAAAPKVQAFYQFYKDQYSDSVPETNCGSWVDWYGEKICDVDTLARVAGHETIDAEDPSSNNIYTRPKLLSFDHVTPDPSRLFQPPSRTAILYANPFSKNFQELHNYLCRLSSGKQPRIEYVFRHKPANSNSHQEKSYLSGYGVALDLKKMDYLVLDDRRAVNTENDGSSSQESLESDDDLILSLIEQYPLDDTDTSSPLSEEELKDLSLKATQLIVNSSNPLVVLKQLSQNFPKYASALSHHVVLNQSLVDEVQDNRLKVPAGINMMWLNGLSIQETDLTPLGLVRLLRKERGIARSLASIGLSPIQAVELLTNKDLAKSQSESAEALEGFFDASDRQEGGETIIWWNDITKDSRYARWNPSLTGLLRQVYPGQFHNIRQNLINVIIVSDLSRTSSLNYIAGPINNIISRGFPLRFGVVPNVETEDGTKMAKLFYYMINTFGRAKTMNFLGHIGKIQASESSVDWTLIRNEYTKLKQGSDSTVSIAEFDSIFDGSIDESSSTEDEASEEDNSQKDTEKPALTLAERVERANVYIRRLDATQKSFPGGHAFVNGKHFDLDDSFLKLLQTEMNTQITIFQEKIYLGELGDANVDKIDTYFYDIPEAYSRRNRYVFPSSTINGLSGSARRDLRIVSLPEVFEKSDFTISPNSYIYPEGKEASTTIFVIADLDSEFGVTIALEALKSLDAGLEARLSFIHNPVIETPRINDRRHHISPVISNLVYRGLLSNVPLNELKAILSLESSDYKDFVEALEQVAFSEDHGIKEILREAGSPTDGTKNSGAHEKYETASKLLLRDIGIAPGDLGLLINGRVIGPIEYGSFDDGDFATLVEYEKRKRTGPIIEALKNTSIPLGDVSSYEYSEFISLASSVVSSVLLPDPSEQGLFNGNQRPRQTNYKQLADDYTSFSFGDPETSIYHFGILLDPLSETAQKWSSFLELVASVPYVYAQVYLNPGIYTEMPLKRFYRYSLPPRLSFNENGDETQAQIVFSDLPVEPIYTLGMDVPPSWLVRPKEAYYDLDNIQLTSLSPEDKTSGLNAIFELDYIVIEGHARDVLTNAPPRGLQLELSSLDGSPIDDTQVVLNMGYIQFKAFPGVFQLDIREGRGRDIYLLESAGNEGWNSPTVPDAGTEITVTSFEGLTLYPRVRRRPGMERADVLDEFVIGDEEPEGILNDIASRIKSFFKPQEPEVKAIAPRQADINIFTVASGLLYERFASIMILSVLKNTDSSVKFWFIENFLSPSFLEFLPHFAEAYNFEYELVTYKWPSWLRAQKEKQRIIWAYKILFLDVLFPMDLKKVIFVDADQIVRADLQELVDLDLHGAPYGYTPMGDDNTDMEGFRFWKTGYWKDFLKGRPYHISALYVVDLARFRQVAAGDILRHHYQQLSQDPNSLANLDQDLPNNLQREVPIFSLHEDWLWCETWCSKERLHRAKTIDLCQNPLTKEPKLSRARQIPEWEEYDAEIARFARKLADEGKIRSHVSAADANALANAASGTGTPESHDKPVNREADTGEDKDIGRQGNAEFEGVNEAVGDEEQHRKDEL